MGENKYYCKIDGVVYNLKKIQDIIDEDPESLGGVKIDLALYDEYHLKDPTVCLLSQIIKESKEIPADYNEALKELQARNRKKYGIPERFRPSDDFCNEPDNSPRKNEEAVKYTRENKYSCRIDGEVYDLKKIQDIMDEDPEGLGGVKIDLALYDEYHLKDPTVWLLSQIIKETKEIPADYNEALKELQARNRKKYGIPERFRPSDDFCNEPDNSPRKNEESVKYTRENKYSCRIDGEVYDLKKIQDIIDEDPEGLGGVKIDLALYDEYHLKDPTVWLLSQIIKESKEIPADYNEALKELQARNRKKYGIPERFRPSDGSDDKNSGNKGCPRCGSTSIAHYSRNIYNYQCRRCKHTWSQCPKCGGTEITCWSTYEPNGGYNLYSKVCSKCKHRWMEQG